MTKLSLKSPFLKQVTLKKPSKKLTAYPFNIPVIASGFNISFDRAVTFFVGENGSGKSTILEAIAAQCGFNLTGGNRNHLAGSQKVSDIAKKIKTTWLPRINKGFFLRAESFFDFASYIDKVAETDKGILLSYGGKSLHELSHGESFLALFNNRFGEKGIYLLDEPEAALSPMRQLSLLRIIRDLEASGRAQFVIASHSPILLSYPGAELLNFDADTIKPVAYEDTEHYKLTKAFLDNPERYYRHLF